MSNASDFIIENGVLKKYVGPGGDVVIPEGVTAIANWALAKCENIKSLLFPESTTKIGNGAFAWCQGLEQVEFSGNVPQIGFGAFLGCEKLADENGFVVVDNVLYGYYGSCAVAEIPNGITTISYEAFKKKDSLERVILPDSVTKIEQSAISFCDALTELVIPANVIDIAGSAISFCGDLRQVIIASCAKNFGSATFYGCIPKIIISPEISFSAYTEPEFKLSAALGFVQSSEQYDPLNAEDYAKYAVSQRKKLLPTIFEQDLVAALMFFADKKKITASNFEQEYLTPATQANAVNCIAFLMDWKDKNISSKAKNQLLEKELTKDPYNAADMKKVWSFGKNEDGTLTITAYKGTDTYVTVPERIGTSRVTELGKYAFGIKNERATRSVERVAALQNIIEITIPDSITTVGDHAFYGCCGLKRITLPEGITSIGDGTFVGCSSLEKIKIPESVVIIGDEAFYDCKALTDITIPKDVTSVGCAALMGCRNLLNVTIAGKSTVLKKRSVSGAWNSLTIHAPAGSYAEAYAKENNIPFVAE